LSRRIELRNSMFGKNAGRRERRKRKGRKGERERERER
jgi:hypothetical protein